MTPVGEGLVVASATAPAQVLGVHGSAGLSWWKCFARGSALSGAWEAVEWARVPPGGLSGVHLHTRTEEVYFILAGQGEILLNGAARAVGAGDVVLTGLGDRHGLRNTGPGDLDWLVIELVAPPTAAVLGPGPAPRPSAASPSPAVVASFRPSPGEAPGEPPGMVRDEGQGEDSMDGARLQCLREPGEIFPREVLTGPLRRIARERLAAGEVRAFRADGRESTLFVLGGAGTIAAASVTLPLAPGSSVTFPLGSVATVEAAGAGLDLFVAELDVLSGAAR